MAFATVIDGIVSGCFCHGITLLNPEKRPRLSSGLAVQDRQPPTPAKLVRERWSGLSPGVVETARRTDPLARYIVTPGIDLRSAAALLYSQECEDPRSECSEEAVCLSRSSGSWLHPGRLRCLTCEVHPYILPGLPPPRQSSGPKMLRHAKKWVVRSGITGAPAGSL